MEGEGSVHSSDEEEEEEEEAQNLGLFEFESPARIRGPPPTPDAPLRGAVMPRTRRVREGAQDRRRRALNLNDTPATVLPVLHGTAVPYSSVEAFFGEPANVMAIQDVCQDLNDQWTRLRNVSLDLRGPLTRVLDSDNQSNAHDPLGRILAPGAVKQRRMCQRIMLDYLSTCSDTFASMAKVFLDNHFLLGLNFVHLCSVLCDQSKRAREHLKLNGCPKLKFLDCFIFPDNDAPVTWIQPDDVVSQILSDPCLMGVRVSEPHWKMYTTPAIFTDVMAFPRRIAHDAHCLICMDDFRDPERSKGGVLVRRCNNQLFGNATNACSGHACSCNSNADGAENDKLIHTQCMSKYFYGLATESFAGGYAKCPSCNAQFCLMDLMSVTLVHADAPAAAAAAAEALPPTQMVLEEKEEAQSPATEKRKGAITSSGWIRIKSKRKKKKRKATATPPSNNSEVLSPDL